MTEFKLDGFAELDRALGQLPKATARNVLMRTIKRAAEPIRVTAEQLAPDDPATGPPDLHTEIATSNKQKSGRQKKYRLSDKYYVEVFVGPTSKHAKKGQFQEFGTFKDNPQPFMRPAWEANRDRALNIIKVELGGEIEKAAKRYAKKLAKGA